MSSKNILFMMSGSIACFKACSVLSSLVKAGHTIEVVATAGALKFVGEATLEGLTGRKVHSSVFERGSYMDHIHIMRWADLVLLCPASANTLGKFANGLGDDLVSTLFLAHDFKKPFLIAPAMNQSMYSHPATQVSLAKLSGWGVTVLDTASGALACGEEGAGRMLDPNDILRAIDRALEPDIASMDEAAAIRATVSSVLRDRGGASTSTTTSASSSPTRRILITSGGTEEPIDGVRSITNTSTGRTGAELATWFADHGYAVTLLHSARAVLPQVTTHLTLKAFTTFSSLESALRETLRSDSYDAVIHAAAVADYSLAEVESNGVTLAVPLKGKLESGETLTLKLKKNAKIVDSIRAFSPTPLKLVAFKLTRTLNQAERVRAVTDLVAHSKPDVVVHNDFEDIAAGHHRFSIIKTLGLHRPDSELFQPTAEVSDASSLAGALAAILFPNAKDHPQILSKEQMHDSQS